MCPDAGKTADKGSTSPDMCTRKCSSQEHKITCIHFPDTSKITFPKIINCGAALDLLCLSDFDFPLGIHLP